MIKPGRSYQTVRSRVSSKWTKKNFGSNRNKPKRDLFRVCFGLFRETNKEKFSVCFGVSNLYRNNRNKQNCFETNRNNPVDKDKRKKSPKTKHTVAEQINYFWKNIEARINIHPDPRSRIGISSPCQLTEKSKHPCALKVIELLCGLLYCERYAKKVATLVCKNGIVKLPRKVWK